MNFFHIRIAFFIENTFFNLDVQNLTYKLSMQADLIYEPTHQTGVGTMSVTASNDFFILSDPPHSIKSPIDFIL